MAWLSTIADGLRFVVAHQFIFAGLLIVAMFAPLAWGKRGSMGKRAKMREIEAGMESGWATAKEVKPTGLYE